MVTGKLCDAGGQSTEAEFLVFPDNEKIVDLACAAHFIVALGEAGNVYYWGKMQVRLVLCDVYIVPGC